MTDTHGHKETSFKGMVLRAIAVIGLVAILLLGAWGIIQIAFALPGFLHTFFSSNTPSPTIAQIDQTVATPSTPHIEVPTPTTAAQPTQKPTPLPVQDVAPKSTVTRTSTLYGSPDLSVSILSIQPSGNRYTMQFIVSNMGTNVSAAGWVLTAHIPLTPVYTYTSAVQPGLYPGDKIIYTLTFDVPTYGYGYPTYNDRTVRIIVDPQGYITEYNRLNNTAATQI